jgi:hypothetical protein
VNETETAELKLSHRGPSIQQTISDCAPDAVYSVDFSTVIASLSLAACVSAADNSLVHAASFKPLGAQALFKDSTMSFNLTEFARIPDVRFASSGTPERHSSDQPYSCDDWQTSAPPI